jgi:hypothetical protein
MNRLVTLLALAMALGGPASAAIISPYAAPLGVNNTNVVAGQVSDSGVIERGHGFRVGEIQHGVYESQFDRRYFPSGCAAMVVSTTTAALLPVVSQRGCGSVFQVLLYGMNRDLVAGEFQFIAREDAPEHS